MWSSVDAIKRLDGVRGLGVVELDGGDIVRHPMIREILRRYKGERDEPEEAPVSATECVLQEMA